MLWLALRLPRLALDVFADQPTADGPTATEPKSAHTNGQAGPSSAQARLVYECRAAGKKVLLSNDQAAALGVRAGMSLASAEALLQSQANGAQATTDSPKPTTDYRCFPRQPSREWVALQQLAAICYDFTPHVDLHNPPALGATQQQATGDCGLLLEISGSLRLFQGVERLCQLLHDKISPRHYITQTALGPSAEGAWLLSQGYNRQQNYCEQDFQQRLEQTPLAAIDCFQGQFEQLRKMGLNQVRQVLALPIDELGRRFGHDFIRYLQALRGQQSTALQRHQLAVQFRQRLQLEQPLSQLPQLAPAVSHLLQQLSQFLRREQRQCHAIEWRLLSATGQQQTITVVCQPVHSDWQLLQQLTNIHFNHVQLTFEVDCLELCLQQHTAMQQANGDLFAGDPDLVQNHQEVTRQWQLLLTRLHNRLGQQSTRQLTMHPEHWPEQLNQWQHSQVQGDSKSVPPVTPAPAAGTNYLAGEACVTAPRPSWLIDPPVALRTHNHQVFWRGPLTLALGPERIQGRWWQAEQDQCRDYFVAEQDDCRWLWIYHDQRQKQWFLQGIFA